MCLLPDTVIPFLRSALLRPALVLFEATYLLELVLTLCGEQFSTCMHRYMRGMRLRWPLRNFTNGRPVDLINFEQKAALLAAGYALVTIDVRGTGALPPSLAFLHCTTQKLWKGHPPFHVRVIRWWLPQEAVADDHDWLVRVGCWFLGQARS